MNMRYYEVDVPTTKTVFIRGEDLSPEDAIAAAVRMVEKSEHTESECDGYSSVEFAGRSDGLAITMVALEVTGMPMATDTTDDTSEG